MGSLSKGGRRLETQTGEAKMMIPPEFNASVFLGNDKLVRKIQRKYAAMFHDGEVVLDLGCGNGVFLRLLRDRNVRGVGVDSFPPCVDSCRTQGFEIHQSDLLDFLRQAGGSYDGIFCSHIVEHLTPAVVLELISHAGRLLRPGGRLIIITPNPKDITVITEVFWLDITHVRPYPILLLTKMLEHGGFSIEKSGYDSDSSMRLLAKNPLRMMKKILKKLRWGEYWGTGDGYVVGRKG